MSILNKLLDDLTKNKTRNFSIQTDKNNIYLICDDVRLKVSHIDFFYNNLKEKYDIFIKIEEYRIEFEASLNMIVGPKKVK
ncbi:MAG: hypothetical protein ACPKQO_04740 [Nitrososphaeraceae archaeon]